MTSQRQSTLDRLLSENPIGPFQVCFLCWVAPRWWALPGGGAGEALRGGGGFLPRFSEPLSDLQAPVVHSGQLLSPSPLLAPPAGNLSTSGFP